MPAKADGHVCHWTRCQLFETSLFVPKQPFKWNIKYQAFMKTKWIAYERSLLPVANVSTDAVVLINTIAERNLINALFLLM